MASDHATSPFEGLEEAVRDGFHEHTAGDSRPEPTIYRPPVSWDATTAPTAPWIVTFRQDADDRRKRRLRVGTGRWLRARIIANRLSSLVTSGYEVENEALYRVWNIALALPILVVAAPVMAVLAVVLFATQGRPIIYRGERLGKDRKPFDIYKFRTLCQGADKFTQNRVLPACSSKETKLGSLLRDCRLDELPQLFNVLEGSMNMFGPRPVRPGIAEIASQEYDGYEKRFAVRPGVFGATQAVMTHRTPKRLRALYNSRLLRIKARAWVEPLIICAVGLSAVFRLFGLLIDRLQSIVKAGHMREQRKGRRVRRTDTTLFVRSGSMELACGQVVDINDHAFLFEPDPGVVISEGQHDFVLCRAAGLFRRPRAARCRGIVRVHPGRQGLTRGPKSAQGYIVFYGPTSPLNAYMIDKYFLINALVA